MPWGQQRSFLARSTSRFWRRQQGEHTAAGDGARDGTVGEPSIGRRFFPLFFTHFTQGVFITLPFLLAAYMVRDFARQGGGEPDEQTLGRLIGLLGATFCGSQLLTSYLIGRLSDRVGRKPIVVVGNFFCILSATTFGLSRSYLEAILSRVLGGLFNGIIGAEKAMLGEALSPAGQATAFGYFSLAWGLGALCGPLVGGVFSVPCAGLLRGTAACGADALLERRPFLLPCLVAASMSGLATVLTLFCLEETLPTLRRGGGDQRGEYAAVPSSGPDAEAEGPAKRELQAAAEPGSKGVQPGQRAVWEVELGPARPGGKAESGAAAGKREADGELIASVPGNEEQQQRQQQQRLFRDDSAKAAQARGQPKQASADDEQPGADSWDSLDEELALLGQRPTNPITAQRTGSQGIGAPAAEAGAGAAAGQGGGSKGEPPQWWRERNVLLALAGYGLIAFYFNMSDEVVPIFASAPPSEGGLGFSTSQLAPSLTFGGAVLMLWALWGFPAMLRRYGTVRVCRTGLWATPFFAVLYPLASLVAGRTLPAQAVIFLAMGLRGVASTNSFTACIILVNAAAPPGTLGAVNGVGQTVAAAVRAAAPALGGLVWGWSTSLGLAGHQFLPFASIAAVALGTLFVYRELHLPVAEVTPSSKGGDGGTAEAVATAVEDV